MWFMMNPKLHSPGKSDSFPDARNNSEEDAMRIALRLSRTI
jgi:hypothetical protein